MKRAMLILGLLALLAPGCSMTARETTLDNDLAYTPAPLADVTLKTDKAIVVLPLVDTRANNDADLSTSACWNFLPLVWYTTSVDTHPELVYQADSGGMSERVTVTGTLADAIPKLLVEQLKATGRAPKAQYTEGAEGEGFRPGDLVLRGRLVNSALTTKLYSYCLGPAAIVPYLLGAPFHQYSAWVEVEWQLYDANNKPIGGKRTASATTPVAQYAGLCYGWSACGKEAPLGLYIDAIKAVNENIARDLSEMLAR